MSEHTPGPWEVDGDEVWSPEIYGSICMVLQQPGADANARLIAAAPDLLTALKDITRFCDAVRVQVGMGKTQTARLDAARAAIAKAEGR